MTDRQLRFDEAEYFGHAVGLSQGSGYVDDANNRVAYWPVGYPFILSLVYRVTGPSRNAAVGLQIILGRYPACLLIVTMIFTGDPRYHFPLVPFMLLYISKALLFDVQPLIANLRRGDPSRDGESLCGRQPCRYWDS